MKIPETCPHCQSPFDGSVRDAYLIVRTGLDFDSDEEGQIEDSIYECAKCHTLFRARWKLLSFVELIEKGEGR